VRFQVKRAHLQLYDIPRYDSDVYLMYDLFIFAHYIFCFHQISQLYPLENEKHTAPALSHTLFESSIIHVHGTNL